MRVSTSFKQKRRSVKRAYLRVDLATFLDGFLDGLGYAFVALGFFGLVPMRQQAVKASLWTYSLLSFLAAALSLAKHSASNIVGGWFAHGLLSFGHVYTGSISYNVDL
jgi:hypothetical protein